MKKLIASALLITSLLASGFAYAGYWGYYAVASSPSAWGWGFSANRNTARNLALNNCVTRTPNWETCYVTSVTWKYMN